MIESGIEDRRRAGRGPIKEMLASTDDTHGGCRLARIVCREFDDDTVRHMGIVLRVLMAREYSSTKRLLALEQDVRRRQPECATAMQSTQVGKHGALNRSEVGQMCAARIKPRFSRKQQGVTSLQDAIMRQSCQRICHIPAQRHCAPRV